MLNWFQAMDSSKKSPRSHFSTDTSSGIGNSMVETQSESRPRLFVPPDSARIARKSSVYSTASETQSIIVFTDVEELLSPEIREIVVRDLKEPATDSKSKKPQTKFKLFPSDSRPKLSRLDSLTPKPLRLVFQPPPKKYNGDPEAFDVLVTPYEIAPPRDRVRDYVQRYVDISRPPRRSFYHPKRILRFTGLFSEPMSISQQHPLASVDKILPPPPYHVFDHKRKGWLLALLTLTALLSPLSSGVYFPTIRAIATVCKLSHCTTVKF